jgi:hypothetical protein
MPAYGKHARHVYWTNHSRLDRDNDGTAFEAWVVRRGQHDAEDPRKTAEDTRHRLATPSRDRKERYPRHGSISRQAPGVRIGPGAAIRDLQASRTLSPPATTAPRELTRQISHRWSPSMRRGQSWHASSPPRNASPSGVRQFANAFDEADALLREAVALARQRAYPVWGLWRHRLSSLGTALRFISSPGWTVCCHSEVSVPRALGHSQMPAGHVSTCDRSVVPRGRMTGRPTAGHDALIFPA